MNIARRLAAGLCLLGLAAAPARAQGPTAGVEAGVSFSRISPALDGQSVSMKPGLLAGVYAVVPLLKTVGIQLELVYAQKNSQLTTAGRTSDLKLDYVEIPVLAKLPIFKGIYILEGASFDIPVRGRTQASGGAEVDIKSQLTNPDVGMVIAGGVPIQNFAIEGRYEGGFRKINNTAGAAIQRHRSFSFLARVHF